jgi:hypothetical protein
LGFSANGLARAAVGGAERRRPQEFSAYDMR